LALPEGGKLGAAHHCTVVIHELGKHADRRQTGEAAEIDGRAPKVGEFNRVKRNIIPKIVRWRNIIPRKAAKKFRAKNHRRLGTLAERLCAWRQNMTPLVIRARPLPEPKSKRVKTGTAGTGPSPNIRRAGVVLGLENPSLALRNGLRVKVAAMTATTHNPSEEPCWVSCLRENFMSSSYGEELETGPAARSGTAPVPHPTTVLRLDRAQSTAGKGL
jgi:hypothetical protein